MSKETGGPAFPIQGHSTRNGQGFQLVMADGMSIRDYFAAKAMQSFLTADGTTYFDNRAKAAYEMADTMLKAREA
jgi:hypothetical protein